MAISPNKEAMLRALANYKYLTVSHILKLGISISKDKSAQYFRDLQKDYEFVGRQIHYGLAKDQPTTDNIKRTRHEYLWHLTVTGAKYLDSHTEISLPDIRFPKKPKQYLSNDYFHRVSTISMYLAFDKRMQQLPHSKHQFLTYYQQNKSSKAKRFESETRLLFKDGRHFSPDALCTYTTPDDQNHLFVLEVYNSNGNNRIKYVIEQLEKLFWIIDKTRKIEKKMGIDAVPRILCTCSNETLLQSVIERIKSNKLFWVEHIEQLLFLNLDKNVWDNFANGWMNIEGKSFDLALLQPIQ